MAALLSDDDVFGAPPAPAASAPQQPAWRMVAPHPAPDGSGETTNLSDADYLAFRQGAKAPAGAAPAKPSIGEQAIANVRAGKPAIGDQRTPEPPVAPQLLSDDDVFGAPAPKSKSGYLANIGAGAVEGGAGAINAASDPFGNVIGKPLATGAVFAHDLLAPAFGYKRFTPEERSALLDDDVPQIGTRAANAVGRAMGAPSTDSVQADTTGQRLTRAAAAGATGAPATGIVGTGINALASAGGEGLSEIVPEWAAPMAQLVGIPLTGTAASLTEAGARAAGTATRNAGRQFVAPLTSKGQTDLAAARLQGAATDKSAAIDALDANPHEIVPGSRGTTFQVSGDLGLGNLERSTAAKSPNLFINQAAEQNKARLRALQSERIAPSAASPQSVVSAVRAVFDRMDAANAVAEDNARQSYETAQAAQPAPQIGALAAAQNETSVLGGHVPVGADAQETALQGYGNAMRGRLAAARDADKDARAAISNAVDPDGTLAIDTSPISEGAKRIAGEMSPNAKDLEGEPAKIFATASALPRVQRFADVFALRSRITAAMRDELSENGKTPAYAMMSRLLGELHGALDPAVQARAAAEARAVAAGKVAPARTMAARLQAQADAWRQQRANQSGANAAGSSPNGTRPPAGGGVGGLSGVGRGPRAGQLRSGNGRRDPRVAAQQADDLAPNWTEEAAERDRAAQEGWAEHYQTYGAPGVGEVLRPGQRRGEFRVEASRVPTTLMTGRFAAERLQAYLRAGGDRQALIDFAAFDLRRSAEVRDGASAGTLDPRKAAAWLAAHDEAATVLPELRDMGTNAVAARRAFDEATARAQEARDTAEDAAKGVYRSAAKKRAEEATAFQRSAAGKLLGDKDPVAAIGQILRGDTAVADMRRLAALTSGSTSARMGLRRAVVQFILREFKGNTLAGDTGETALKSDAYQTFMRRAAPALAEIFPREHIEVMRAIAADLQRAAKSVSATKLPGGSNTAQDVLALTKHSLKQPSLLAQMIGSEAIGFGLGAPGIGSLTALGSLALSVMRKAGFAKVDDMVAEAMLNPEFGKALLLRPLPNGETRALSILQQRLRAVATASAASTGRDERRAANGN